MRHATISAPLVDLHVNGLTLPKTDISRAEVVDFSSPNLTLDYVRRATERLVELGTDMFLATVVTGEPEGMVRSLRVLSAAMDEPWGSPILGIHIEGPFLSRMCKGAHPARHVLEHADRGVFDRLFEAARERVVLATVSPAIRGAPDFIEYIADHGVSVSLGHHNATTTQIEEAFSAGATGLTHAGNAWSKQPPASFPKNTEVLAQLAAAGVYVMVIPDGEHVPCDFIRYTYMIVEGMRPGHIVWVSDCSPVAGAPEGSYTVYDHLHVCVHRTQSGVLRAAPLSGSYLTLRECLSVLQEVGCVPQADIIQGATANPLAFVEGPLTRIGRAPIDNEANRTL